MPFSFVFLKLFLLFIFFIETLSTGDFWFVTDFHIDQNYSRTGDPNNLCHEGSAVLPDAGLYGNFLCDSPLTLLEASIVAMKNIQSNPDFIIWTGDNLPHTKNFDPDWDVIFEGIKNISESLQSRFPSVPIYPSIGNHDTFPPNVLLPTESTIQVYKGYLEKGGWSKFLPESAHSTFEQGGFYDVVVKPGLRLISLNTILWYFPNEFTKHLKDPANQFKWLNDTLKTSLHNSEKVYIIGHVPPGYYNRVKPGKKGDPTFHKHFSEKLLEILHEYADVVIGQMYGHLHMDMFQLFQFNTGVFRSSSILASSVTPWHQIDKHNVSLPVNPTIRLMHYSTSDFSLKDYDQYYLNLTKVNSLNKNSEEVNLYEHLYKFTDAYDVPDLSTKSLIQVYETLKRNQSVFNSFFCLATGGKCASCDEDCKVAQLCSISSTSTEEYNLCMKTVNEINIPDQIPAIVNMNVVMTVVITLLIMLLIVLFLLYQKCWKAGYWRYQQETDYERFMSFD